jgi:hypothetical protein
MTEVQEKAPPQDVRPQWLKVARRLQSVARDRTQGFAVLNITVLVDQNGNPICWNSPTRRNVEPKSANVLLMLGGGGELLE